MASEKKEYIGGNFDKEGYKDYLRKRTALSSFYGRLDNYRKSLQKRDEDEEWRRYAEEQTRLHDERAQREREMRDWQDAQEQQRKAQQKYIDVNTPTLQPRPGQEQGKKTSSTFDEYLRSLNKTNSESELFKKTVGATPTVDIRNGVQAYKRMPVVDPAEMEKQQQKNYFDRRRREDDEKARQLDELRDWQDAQAQQRKYLGTVSGIEKEMTRAESRYQSAMESMDRTRREQEADWKNYMGAVGKGEKEMLRAESRYRSAVESAGRTAADRKDDVEDLEEQLKKYLAAGGTQQQNSNNVFIGDMDQGTWGSARPEGVSQSWLIKNIDKQRNEMETAKESGLYDNSNDVSLWSTKKREGQKRQNLEDELRIQSEIDEINRRLEAGVGTPRMEDEEVQRNREILMGDYSNEEKEAAQARLEEIYEQGELDDEARVELVEQRKNKESQLRYIRAQNKQIDDFNQRMAKREDLFKGYTPNDTDFHSDIEDRYDFGGNTDVAYIYQLLEEKQLNGEHQIFGEKGHPEAYLMDDKETKTFVSLVNENKIDEAWAFYSGLRPYLNQLYSKYEASMWEDAANRFPILSFFAARGANVLQIPQFVMNVPGYIEAMATGKDNYATDAYGSAYAQSRIKNLIDNQISNNAGDYGWVYRGFSSGVDSAINASIAQGLGLPEQVQFGDHIFKAQNVAMLSLFASQAFETSLQNTMAQGNNNFAYDFIEAFVDSVIETATEIWSVENFLADPTNILTYITKLAISEPSEEVAGAIIEPFIKEMIGHGNQYKIRADEIWHNGFYEDANGNKVKVSSFEEAERQAMREWNHDIRMAAQEALISVAPGGLYGAAKMTSENRSIGRQVQETQFENGTTGLENMLENAQQMEPGTKSFQEAQKISERLQQEKKPGDFRVGQLARDMMRESQEQAIQNAENALRNEVRKELAGKEIKGSSEAEMTDLIVKAINGGGIESLTKKEREKIHDSSIGYNTLMKFSFASEQSSRAVAAQTEATAKERQAMQSVSDALTQKKTQTAPDDFVGKQLATQDDIDRAEGKRTGRADEVIVGRQFGKLNGMELVEKPDGTKEWKYNVTIPGQKEPVHLDASEIKATNFSTAAVIRQQLDNPAVYSGDYFNHLMKRINTQQNTKIGNYLRDAENVRWAAFFGEDIPATGLSEDEAKEIYRLSQADLRSEWMKDQASRAENFRGKGNGTATFGGTEFGSEEWNRKLDESGLTEDEKKTVNGLAALAVSSGIQFNFVDQIKNNGLIHGYEAQDGITIALRSYDSKEEAEKNGRRHEIVVTVGHELTHWLRRNNASGYIELQNYVVNTMKDRGVNIHARAQEILDNRAKAGDNLTMSGAIEEMVANACDQVMASQEAADYLEKNNPGLYDKIRSYVKDLVQRIKTMFAEKKGWASASRDAVYNMGLVGEQVNELNRIWWGKFDEVLSGQVKQLEAAQPAEGKENYSFAEDIEKQRSAARNAISKRWTGKNKSVNEVLDIVGRDYVALNQWLHNTFDKGRNSTTERPITRKMVIDFINNDIINVSSIRNGWRNLIESENNNKIIDVSKEKTIKSYLRGSTQFLVKNVLHGNKEEFFDNLDTESKVRIDEDTFEKSLIFNENNGMDYDDTVRVLMKTKELLNGALYVGSHKNYAHPKSYIHYLANTFTNGDEEKVIVFAVHDATDKNQQDKYDDRAYLAEIEIANKEDAYGLLRWLSNDGEQETQFKLRLASSGNNIIALINAVNPEKIRIFDKNLIKGKNMDIHHSMAEEPMSIEDAVREWDEAKKERDALRKQYQELNGGKEHMDMLRKVQDAMGTPEADAAIEEYSRWEKETGLGDLARRYEEAKKRTDQAAKNYDRAYNAAQEAEEREAIAKSGLSEQDWRRKQAVKEFGYTTNFREAGYMLPNGQMLNFTGEKGKHYGTRGQDHRAIGIIYAGDRYTGSEAMLKFMDEGNIRVMAETPGIDISSTNEPTSEQYSTIRKMARQFASEEYFNIDFTDERGNTVDSIEYDGRVNPEKIVNDIKYFFKNGTAPQQSLVSQFHYSMAEDDAADIGVWMMGLTESSVHTEGERALIREYRGLKTSLELSRKRQGEYMDKIAKLQTKSQLTAEERDTLIILQNKLQVQQDKQARLEQELYDVTRSEGYAGMMYRNSKIFDDYVNGKNQQQVEAAVDTLINEAEQAEKNIEKRQREIRRMAEDAAVNTIRKELKNRGLSWAANEMKKNYFTAMSTGEIEGRLAEIVLRAVNGEDITAEIESLASDMVTNGVGFGSEIAEEALSNVRGMTIEIGPGQQAEMKTNHLTLKDLRERTKGSGVTFKYGTRSTLDVNAEEIGDLIPDLRESLKNEKGSLQDFVDWIERQLDAKKGNAQDYGVNPDEVAVVIITCANAMMDAEQGGMSPADLRKRIAAAQGEIGKLADAVDGLMQSAKEMKNSAMKASNATGGLRADAVAAIDYYNLIAKQAAEVERNRVKRTVIDELRSENTRKLIEQQMKFQEMLKKDRRARELQHDNEQLRKVITTDVKRLKDRLVAETDLKNVQEEAKPLARQLVSMLVDHDMAGWRHVLFSDKRTLTDVQMRLEKMEAANGSFDMDADLDFLVIKAPNAEDNDYSLKDKVLEDLMHIEQGLLEYRNAEGRGNVSLADRKAALEKVQEAVSEIYDVIRARETAFIQGQKRNVLELATQMERDMAESRFKGERKGRGSKARNAMVKAVNYGNMTPEYFFKYLRNGTMELLHKGLQDAEQRSGLEAREAQERIEKIAKDTGFATWDGQEKKTVKLKNGKQIQMSVEQLMALYATWNREKNQLRPEETSHLLKGGFVLAENDASKGKARREKSNMRPIRVNEDDLNSIGSYLTDQQKQYADAIVEYMSTDLAKIGNEASLQTYGIKKFTESYYFPTKSWGGVLNKSSASGISNQNENRAMRQSFTKRIQAGARNALEIGDFTATAMKHITGMITFNTVGPAVENLNKVLNQQLDYYEDEEMDPDEAYKRNMRTAFAENYGLAAKEYLERFMEDVNGGVGRRMETSPQEKLLSVFRKGAVAGSLSVSLQQPLSYIRAAMEIDTKYLLGALSPTQWGRIHDEMTKYSGIAVIKDMGRFDMNQGQSMIEYITPEGKENAGKKAWEKFSELTTIGPEKMDAITWGRMWIACKLEQQAMNPGMDTKSDEFLQKVAERFNDVMRRTQVYDSVMVKSQNMRSKNYAIKAMTSFMAEPTLSLNVLADAVVNAQEKGGKAKLAKAAATFLLSAAAQAAAKALMSSGRSPDKRKTWEEQFLTKWASMFISEANPLGLIPGFSDIVEVLKNGELTDDAMGVLGKIQTIWQKSMNWISGKDTDTYRSIEDTFGQVFQLFTNVPVKNLMRDGRAMYNFFNPNTYAKRETSGAVIRYGILDAIHTQDNLTGVINKYMNLAGAGYFDTTSEYAKRIYEAQKRGDEQAAKDMRDYYVLAKSKAQDPEKNLSTALNSMAKKDKSLSAEEKIAALEENGYKSTGTFILDQLKKGEIDRKSAEELYRKERPDADEKKIAETLDGAEWTRDGKSLPEWQKEYTNYTPLYAAMMNNKAEEIRDAVDRMTKLGYDAKAIRTDVNKKIKAQYLAADANGRIRLKDAMQKAYKALGFTAEDADKTISNWTKEKKKEGSSAIPGMVGVIGGNGKSDVGSKKKSGNYGKGNINLDDRPIVVNKDGSISTERSFSFWDEDEQKEILIPTVIDGKIVSERKAIDHYYETGEYLGKFDTVKEADEYAEKTHRRLDTPKTDGTPYIANYKGKRIVLDSVIDGEAVSFEEAFQWYLESGDKLASFKTYKEAERYIKSHKWN